MSTFINYTVNGGLSLDTFRAPQAVVTDIADIAEALTQEREENLTCSIDGSELELLEDGSYWGGSDVSNDALVRLHNLLSEV